MLFKVDQGISDINEVPDHQLMKWPLTSSDLRAFENLWTFRKGQTIYFKRQVVQDYQDYYSVNIPINYQKITE